MSSHLALVLALALQCFAVEVDVGTLVVKDGSSTSKYFTTEATKGAERVQGFFTDVEKSFNEYVEKLKTSSAASLALAKYSEAVESVKGTSCDVGDDCLTDAQEDIDEVIQICVAIAPHEDLDTLKSTVTADVAKIKAADDTLRLNADICTSLRQPVPQGCKDTQEKALAAIQEVVSTKELAKLSDLSRKAFFNAKKYIDSCVEKGNKDQQTKLENETNKIKNCYVN